MRNVKMKFYKIWYLDNNIEKYLYTTIFQLCKQINNILDDNNKELLGIFNIYCNFKTIKKCIKNISVNKF